MKWQTSALKLWCCEHWQLFHTRLSFESLGKLKSCKVNIKDFYNHE